MRLLNLACFLFFALLVFSPLCAAAKVVTVGFSQSDTAESDWRRADTQSFQDGAEALRIKLVFKDAGGKTDIQRKQIQELIDQKVDAIVLSANEIHGWDDVLINAKKAKIPVILSDRTIALKPENMSKGLYVAWIGSDFRYEGRVAAAWLAQERAGRCNVVEIQGPPDAAPSIERGKGFREVAGLFPAMKIIASKTGMWRTELGKEVMNQFLKDEGTNICAVFAHNDNMATGALQAIEEHPELGLVPNKNILIIGIDAVKPAFSLLAQEKLSALVECNPILGAAVLKTVQQILAGRNVPPIQFTEEKLFTIHTAKAALPSRKY
jgi:ABC-type sugar transport system substrate-binding protein